MLQMPRASLAGRQGRGISWLLIAALLISAFSQVFPTLVQPPVALAADRMIKMPFASGSTWTISQGYNTNPNNGGSHYNCSEYPGVGCSAQWMYKYSFDLVRADGNTAGQAVLSPVNGTIRWIDEYYGGMSINLGNGWAVAYFHTDLAPGLAAGQSIVQGQWLGSVAQPGGGGNGGFPHIHVTLWKTTDGGNWSRDAQPFTGAQSLDGYDFPNIAGTPLNQYRGTNVTSTNTQIGGATVPRQVAKISPAHGTTVNQNTVALTWAPVTGALTYDVLVDGTLSSPSVSGTSWTTPVLTAGSHTWQVRARNSAGAGAWSSTWRFYVSTGFVNAELDNGAMIGPGKYRVFGTRQGMVGGMTSSGHIIVENDHFVSLPACVKSTCKWLTPGTTDPKYGYVTDCGAKCYVIIENPAKNSCRVAPVEDRGPWFNVDDYWNPAEQRFVNKEIARDGLGYYLAQGYPADAAAFAGYDVGWGKTTTSAGVRGNTNLLNSAGKNYPVTFQTSIDIGDGTWLELGFPWDPGPQTVNVTMLWQVSTSLADAEAKCGGATEPPAPKPAFSFSKSSGAPGATITVTGSGFGKNEAVRVYLDSASTTPMATVTSDSTGAFTAQFTVPAVVGGPHRIHVVGKTSRLRTARTFTILPLASPSKASGSSNLTLTMTGTSFAANEVVNVYWDGSTKSSGSGTADATGTVAITVRAPKTNGVHTAKLTGSTNSLSATTTFKVLQRVRVTPNSGETGATIKVNGTGWPANATVSFRWNSSTGTVLCSAVADATGYMECTFKAPKGTPGTYKVWGTSGTLTASAAFTLTGVGTAVEPSATPTESASPTPTPGDGTPVDPGTPVPSPVDDATVTPEPELPTETPLPTETATEIPAPRTVEAAAVTDTSVTAANPDQAQAPESVAVLQAGGPDGAVTYLSFTVGEIGAGTVTEAYLVLTGTSGGGPGGPIGLVPGYVADESGTFNTLPTQGLSAAVAADGSASTIGAVGPGEVVWVDVTLSVQADGQYTFVIVGDPAQLLELSSREGGGPPKLVLTVQD
jgi:hypothetical protein